MIMVGCWRCTNPSIHFFVSRSRSVVWQAHVQAFTLKLPQDHGRLPVEHISEHSLFSWRRLSRSRSVVWCVVLVVCCFVVAVRVCGVWWSLAHSLSLALSPASPLDLSLSISFSLLYLFFLSSFSSFSLALALVLSLFLLSLIPSRHQTLWKEPINQHDGQLRGICMWSGRTASAQQSVLSLLLSPPSSLLSLLLQKKNFLQEKFPVRNLFWLQFWMNSKKSPPGEITGVSFNQFQNSRPLPRQKL